MFSLTTLFVAASIASSAVANPLPVDVNAAADVAANAALALKLPFVVPQLVAKPGLSGAQSLAAAYRKYRVKMPQNIKAAAAADTAIRAATPVNRAAAAGSGSVVANPEAFDAEYLCPVSIGSNQKVLNLNFDTGSADLWVFSSLQPAAQSSGHDIYTPSSSTSSRQINGATFNVGYGDGSGASGLVYTDTVNVGGVTVTSQAVEAATSVSVEFQQDTNSDGILGLSFSTINTVQPTQQKTFFDNAVAQNRLSFPLFTADLKKGRAGSYGFGAIDNTKYTGSITYTTVNKQQGYWGLTASGYGIGSSAFTATSISGIADTGTTLLLLPNNIVTAYWSRVSGAAYDNNQGAYLFPCSATLPTFTIGVGAARYTLPGPYLNYGPVSSTTCYGGLQSSDGFGINIFGDIFLKGVFVVFDSGNNRIGFANKNL